jgi:hypothetical protein
MKLIALTQGQFAKVDDEDYGWLNKRKWQAIFHPRTKTFMVRHGYKDENQRVRCIYMAREILGLEQGDKRKALFINGDSLDCRRDNIKITDQRGVCCNRYYHRNGECLLGSTFYKPLGKWMAQTTVNGVHRHLGYHDTEQAAHAAYLRAVSP